MSDTQTIAEFSQELSNELAQLSAMLFMTYGEAGMSLRCANDDIQDNFMWGASSRAELCSRMSTRLADFLVASDLRFEVIE